MKLFISWSGQLSREVAQVLHKYLPLAIQGLNVFMSKNDLESGARWSLELATELDESQFGVICLTPDNLTSPWILFEAGALTKHFSGRACGLLLNGLKPVDVSGPLSQFQHRLFDKEEFIALLRDINDKMDSPLGESQSDLIFEKWWPDIEREYVELVKKFGTPNKTRPRRDQVDLLEEVLIKVRNIERSLDFSPNIPGVSSFDALPMEEKVTYLERNKIKNFMKHQLPVVLLSLDDPQRVLLFEIANQDSGIVMKQTIDERYPAEIVDSLKQFGLIEEAGDVYRLQQIFAPEIQEYSKDIELMRRRRAERK